MSSRITIMIFVPMRGGIANAMRASRQLNLSSMPIKQQAIVSSVSNQTPQMLEMLRHYHIGIGTSITVLKHFEFDGSLEIKVLKQPTCIISEQVAKNVFVHYDE